MAGPLSGIGGLAQTPQITPQNQSNTQSNVREQDEQVKEQSNRVQAQQQAPVNSSQETETTFKNNLVQQNQSELRVANDEEQYDANTPRGSLLDIAV